MAVTLLSSLKKDGGRDVINYAYEPKYRYSDKKKLRMIVCAKFHWYGLNRFGPMTTVKLSLFSNFGRLTVILTADLISNSVYMHIFMLSVTKPRRIDVLY